METSVFAGHNGSSYGASDLTRTGDLLITSEMHYRLCYTSKLFYYIRFSKIVNCFWLQYCESKENHV